MLNLYSIINGGEDEHQFPSAWEVEEGSNNPSILSSEDKLHCQKTS